MKFRKIIPDKDLLGLVQERQVQLPPFAVTGEALPAPTKASGGDALVTLAWGTRSYRFVAEYKRLWTPKALADAVAEVQRYARPPELYPLVVVPYLPDARLAELEAAGVSGIDLCGNGVVVIPGEVLVYRTGQPNQFRAEGQIKNVFRGNSSLVARVFLL